MLHRYVEYFKAIADAGSVSAAAQSLNVSQPALSRSLRLLEESVGVALFHRDARGMNLTVYGRALYRHVCFMEREFQHAEDEIERIRAQAAQRLTIGAGLVWLHEVLPYVYARFREQFQRMRIEVYAGDSTVLLQDFVSGRYDIVLCGLQNVPRLDDVACVPMIGPQFTYFARSDHPILDGSHRDVRDHVKRYELAVYKSTFGETYRPEDDHRMMTVIARERIAYVSTSISNLLRTLTITDLIAPLPLACADDARRYSVIEISPELRRPSFESGAIYRSTTDSVNIVENFLSMVKDFTNQCD